MGEPHEITCERDHTHAVCACDGPHTTRTIICNEEQPMTVTPEAVAASAPDEADAEVHAGAYDIPSYEDHGHSHDEETPAPTATTAFLVVVDLDGNAFATAELHKVTEIVPLRPASLQDMRRGCGEIVHDVNAMQISQQTVALMQQSAQQLAEQARAQQIAQAVAARGLKVPGRR